MTAENNPSEMTSNSTSPNLTTAPTIVRQNTRQADEPPHLSVRPLQFPISALAVWFTAACLSCAQPIRGASEEMENNWPAWRGPLQNGVAPVAQPPTEWSETKNVKWKVKIAGEGLATPVVWGEKIFIQTAIPTGKKVEPPAAEATPPAGGEAGEGPRGGPGGRSGRGGGRGGLGGPKPAEVYQFAILCLDRKTGQVLWQQTAREEVPHEARHRTEGSFASTSPVTDGRHLFAYFGSRGLHCYDMNGKLQWSQDFGDMRIAMSFGEGSSPVLSGDTVLVSWDHEAGSFIIALDKNTGKTLWKKTRDERTSWSTPLVVEHEGKRQVVTAATGKIRSYDLVSGDLVWECGGLTRNVIPTPVTGHGMLFATSGYQGSSLLAIRLGKSGDLTGTDAIVWSHKKSTPYVPSPLLYGDKLYLFASNNGVLSCFDAPSGKVLIDAERIESLTGVYASPVAAAGRVYFVGRNGTTLVIKPSDKLEVLATNRLEDKFDASPAVAGKELFLRGRDHLYCLAEN